jgi:RNA polymerase sigma-70 factor (ECF subfamily)
MVAETGQIIENPRMSLSNSGLQKAQKYELLDPDVRLMLQVRDGNAKAFEQLVEKYQARLVAVLEQLVPRRDQAEDLAQEVFMRVYRARQTYVPGAKFSTWLFTITHNVASNALRKLSRRREVNVVNSPSGKFVAQPLERIAHAKSGFMPVRQTDRKEMKIIVQQAIQSLNDRQRMALLLSKFEGMSYSEIAEAMEMSIQAVKSLLSRARISLREILEPYVHSGELPIGGHKFDVSASAIDSSESGEMQRSN